MPTLKLHLLCCQFEEAILEFRICSFFVLLESASLAEHVNTYKEFYTLMEVDTSQVRQRKDRDTAYKSYNKSSISYVDVGCVRVCGGGCVYMLAWEGRQAGTNLMPK